MSFFYQLPMRAHHFVQFCCPPTTPPALFWGKLSVTVKAQKGCDKTEISQISGGSLLLQVIPKGTKGYKCKILGCCK